MSCDILLLITTFLRNKYTNLFPNSLHSRCIHQERQWRRLLVPWKCRWCEYIVMHWYAPRQTLQCRGGMWPMNHSSRTPLLLYLHHLQWYLVNFSWVVGIATYFKIGFLSSSLPAEELWKRVGLDYGLLVLVVVAHSVDGYQYFRGTCCAHCLSSRKYKFSLLCDPQFCQRSQSLEHNEYE